MKSPAKNPNITVDFRWGNDSWYTVKLHVQGRTLTLKYVEFTTMFDEHYKADDFKSLEQVEEFKSRFRPPSKQLQDKDCFYMKEGTTVCACQVIGPNDVRFYDAIVEAVNYSIHNEDECTCSFLLYWQHGPNAGKKMYTGIENICLLEKGRIDPTLTRFLKICRERFEVASDNPGSSFEGDNPASEFVTTPTKPLACASELSKRSKRSSHITKTSKGGSKCHRVRAGQDTDLGGTSILTQCTAEINNCYMMLINNMEKDLTPAVIVDFINKHVSVSHQARVFPCLPSQVYTYGIIAVASQEELTKLSEFLNDPAHIILSSRGRPWVIPEHQSWNGAFGGQCRSLLSRTENEALSKTPEPLEPPQSRLELVTMGTARYKKGKMLSDLFMDFTNHLMGVHKTLALEEHRIMQSPDP